jgi:hypothetical protein
MLGNLLSPQAQAWQEAAAVFWSRLALEQELPEAPLR